MTTPSRVRIVLCGLCIVVALSAALEVLIRFPVLLRSPALEAMCHEMAKSLKAGPLAVTLAADPEAHLARLRMCLDAFRNGSISHDDDFFRQ